MKGLFTTDGRINRQRYFGYGAGLTVILFIVVLIVGVVASKKMEVIGLLLIPLYFVVCWVGICLNAQRLHDFGKSGWWQFLSVVPIAGLILFLVLFFRAGDVGPNAHGPDPLTYGYPARNRS